MRKVAHFIDSDDPGGAETLIIELSKGSRAFGLSPEVFHFGNPWLEEMCRRNGIPCLRAPCHSLYSSAKTIPLFAIAFSRFLRARRIDILHSHLFAPIVGACASAFLNRIPHIGTLHDIYTIEEKRSRVKHLRLASALGTRLVAVSDGMRRRIEELGFPAGRIRVITNGADIDRFQGSGDNALRSKLGISPDETILVCVGRLAGIKRHDVLIEAASKLGPLPYRLLLAGDGPERQRLEGLVSRLGLGSRVMFLGQRDDIPEILKASDAFVLSSDSEGLSCSIVEALSAGLPVIATDVGGNPELVEDGITGFLAPPGDPARLAEALVKVIKDPALGKRLGRAALAKARESLSIQTMLNEYAGIYAALPGIKGAARASVA